MNIILNSLAGSLKALAGVFTSFSFWILLALGLKMMHVYLVGSV